MSRLENAPSRRSGAHDDRPGRHLLPQLPRAADGDHPRHRRYLRSGARPPAALAVQRPLRYPVLPARPRLPCRERQAGGGSPAPGQDARRASSHVERTLLKHLVRRIRRPLAAHPAHLLGGHATTAGPRPWRGARRTASTTSSAWRAIPCCTASHTASPTTSRCAAPKPAPKRRGASPPSTTPPVRGTANAGSSPGWRPPRAASTPATSSPRSAETPAISMKISTAPAARPRTSSSCTRANSPPTGPPARARSPTSSASSCTPRPTG